MENQKPDPARPANRVVGGSEGMLVLDGRLEPIALDGGAQAILNDLDGQREIGASHGALPEALRDLLREKRRNDPNAMRVRLRVEDREYSCRVFLMQPQNDLLDQPIFVLHLRRVASFKDAVRRVGSEYHLTDREQEALIGVSMGLTSKELAVRMNISPNTVNSFMRLIMIKMGVTTRSGIVGKLLKQNTQPNP